MKIIYIIGLILSTCIGVWHFTAPYLYKWYSYIPDAPIEIKRSIDYTNYFFSLLLTGLSIILIIFTNRIFNKNVEILTFYGFLVFVWLNRIIINILLPWNYDKKFNIRLISVSATIFIIQLIPMIYLIKIFLGNNV
jgi:hypothetical protein